MTVVPSIDPARFLDEASPVLLRSESYPRRSTGPRWRVGGHNPPGSTRSSTLWTMCPHGHERTLKASSFS